MSQEQSFFYIGELVIQECVGVCEQVVGFGSCVICIFMLDQYWEFFFLLLLLLVGSFDVDGYFSVLVFWGFFGFVCLLELICLCIDNLL